MAVHRGTDTDSEILTKPDAKKMITEWGNDLSMLALQDVHLAYLNGVLEKKTFSAFVKSDAKKDKLSTERDIKKLVRRLKTCPSLQVERRFVEAGGKMGRIPVKKLAKKYDLKIEIVESPRKG